MLNTATNLGQLVGKLGSKLKSYSLNLWDTFLSAYINLFSGEEKNVNHKDENDSDEEEMAGLFRVVGKKQEKKIEEKDSMNATETSKFEVLHLRDWSNEKV